MSSPLRKRMRSPGFSPHSSAGLSEEETNDGRQSNFKHKRNKNDKNTDSSSSNKVPEQTEGQQAEMVTNGTLSGP